MREHVLRKEKKLHHADMRVVEQRFLHVRACLERQAWHSLVEQHASQGLAPDLFRQRQREIEQALHAGPGPLVHLHHLGEGLDLGRAPSRHPPWTRDAQAAQTFAHRQLVLGEPQRLR